MSLFRNSEKSVQIRSYFWSVFSPNTGKYGPEITPYLDTFHAVGYTQQNVQLLKQQTQPATTRSKSTIETAEKCGKSVKVNNKDARTTDFAHCSGVSIADFEQVNTGWGTSLKDSFVHMIRPSVFLLIYQRLLIPDHQILFSDHQKLKISNLNFFKNYLINRKHHIQFNNVSKTHGFDSNTTSIFYICK